MRSKKNQPFLRRLRFAATGLLIGLRRERSLRFQAVALAIMAILLVTARPEPLWWAMVALTSSAVIATELINTALECLADHLHPEDHPQIRIVKDCAAAAVLVAAAGALAVAAALTVHVLQR
jgi:diacylglycerol kinase (ATP)